MQTGSDSPYTSSRASHWRQLGLAVGAVLGALILLWVVLGLRSAPGGEGAVVEIRLQPHPTFSQATSNSTAADETVTNDTGTEEIDLEVPVRTPVPKQRPETDGTSSSEPIDLTPGARGPEPFTAPDRLVTAPLPHLFEHGPNGELPVTAPNGATSWEAYARPYNKTDTRPKIAILISGIGFSQENSRTAIETLPPEISLGIVPARNSAREWAERARGHGHEIFIEIPMEPFGYPETDPGPYTLLTRNDKSANIMSLNYLMAQTVGYVGVTNYLGGRFTSTSEPLLPVLQELQRRGLMFLDDGSSQRSLVGTISDQINLPWAKVNRQIDIGQSKRTLDESLVALENMAKRDGHAIGIGSVTPMTIDRVTEWARELDDKGIALVPVSAIVMENMGEKR